MIDLLSSLFSAKDFPIQQKNFVKSFMLAFPLFYVDEMSQIKQFCNYDILSRCMIVSYNIVLFFAVSFMALFFLHRIERSDKRNGMAFFIAPVILFVYLGGKWEVNKVLYSFAIPFIPFYIYALLMRLMRHIDRMRG